MFQAKFLVFLLLALALKSELVKAQTSCSTSPCLNNGVCFQTSTTTIYCWCQTNFYGPLCQYSGSGSVITCANNPCQNNGLCVQLTTAVSSCQYNCICMPGYIGTNCQTYVGTQTSCLVNNGNCASGSTCSIDVTTLAVKCLCPPNYTGTYCDQLMNACYSNG